MEDIIMLKNFVRWFIIFGLSFLAANANVLGLSDQGKAFLYLDLGLSILVIIVILVVLVGVGLISGSVAEAGGLSLLFIVFEAAEVAFGLFFTWIVTKIFHLDFYVTYQIVTFVACLFPRKKKDN